MPSKPLRPCSQPGCAQLVDRGRCEAHAKQKQREWDDRRGSSASRGYGHAWRVYRAAYLRDHPLCAECERQHRITAATLVDHIVPHRSDKRLFDDRDNHQALCDDCHNVKRAHESAAARGL